MHRTVLARQLASRKEPTKVVCQRTQRAKWTIRGDCGCQGDRRMSLRTTDPYLLQICKHQQQLTIFARCPWIAYPSGLWDEINVLEFSFSL